MLLSILAKNIIGKSLLYRTSHLVQTVYSSNKTSTYFTLITHKLLYKDDREIHMHYWSLYEQLGTLASATVSSHSIVARANLLVTRSAWGYTVATSTTRTASPLAKILPWSQSTPCSTRFCTVWFGAKNDDCLSFCSN